MLAHGMLALGLADELAPPVATHLSSARWPLAGALTVVGVSSIAALPVMPSAPAEAPPSRLIKLPRTAPVAALTTSALMPMAEAAPLAGHGEGAQDAWPHPLMPETQPPEPPTPETAAPAVVAAAGASPSVDSVAAPPVYATKPPRSTTLRYDLSKGLIKATGELRWRVDGATYDAVLEGSFLGLEVLDWHSAGHFDAAGLAPTRFTDQRKGTAARAANFQRDKALITYSGPDTTFRLYPGAQDRLSWMVQMAAIANARSGGWVAGERITFFVTGARGDASMWHFSVIGRERLNLATGASDTWHLVREADSPRETRVDVWIDPALQNLPVRARMAQSDGDALELRLTGVRAAP